MRTKYYFFGVIGIIGLIILVNSAYIVDETQQTIITQFGEPRGDAKTEAGLYFKVPFIQKVHFFEKRLLEWDGDPNEIPTLKKKLIWVDTFARWRISDPLKFFQSVHTEAEGQARLDDIIDSITREQISSHLLIEVVRNSNRQMSVESEELQQELETALEKVESGRDVITRGILNLASEAMPNFGIELIDFRIKRVNYIERTREEVYDRMISERKRIAEKYRSEGQGTRAEIEGRREKELLRIQSEAYQRAQEIMGRADAEATRIYAEAYNLDPEFYSFTNTLENYRNTMKENGKLIISTDSDFFKYIKRISGR
jgi:membrane protease subunit HflC